MNFGELLISNSATDLDDPEDPKDPKNPFAKEMRILAKRKLNYDNRSAVDLARDASKASGVNPALLLSSSFQEGLNKAIAHPDEVSEAYVNAKVPADFPVDGFYNYGIDKFSDYLPRIQKYLPEGFDQRYKIYPAKNEINEDINTVAFRSNADALTVKAAILRDAMDEIGKYATEKGVELDDTAKNYFTLARYNARPESFQLMMDEYSKAKDKKAFIEKGETSKKKIHGNIYPRLENMIVAQNLLDEK